jgi:hypothetical protein
VFPSAMRRRYTARYLSRRAYRDGSMREPSHPVHEGEWRAPRRRSPASNVRKRLALSNEARQVLDQRGVQGMLRTHLQFMHVRGEGANDRLRLLDAQFRFSPDPSIHPPHVLPEVDHDRWAEVGPLI